MRKNIEKKTFLQPNKLKENRSAGQIPNASDASSSLKELPHFDLSKLAFALMDESAHRVGQTNENGSHLLEVKGGHPLFQLQQSILQGGDRVVKKTVDWVAEALSLKNIRNHNRQFMLGLFFALALSAAPVTTATAQTGRNRFTQSQRRSNVKRIAVDLSQFDHTAAGQVEDILNERYDGPGVYYIGINAEGLQSSRKKEQPQFKGSFGSIPISAKNLRDLDGVLAAKFPHATLILVEDDSHAFSESTGYLDKAIQDAVQGSEKYQEHKDSRTGKSDGIVVVIVVDARGDNLRIYTGESQDEAVRQQGSHWYRSNPEGDYFSLVPDAVRTPIQNRDFTGTVKTIFKTIDGTYESYLADEDREHQEEYESITQILQKTNRIVQTLSEAQENGFDIHGPAQRMGEDAQTFLNRLTNIKGTKTFSRDGALLKLSKDASGLVQRAEDFEEAVNGISTFWERDCSQLQQRLDELSQNDFSWAANKSLHKARSSLGDAKEKFRKGDLNYKLDLNAAADALDSASSEMHSTARILAGVAILAVLATAILAAYANRRRKGSKDKAEESIENLEKKIDEMQRLLIHLSSDTEELVGQDVSQTIKTYKGQTLELAKDIFGVIGNLYSYLGGMRTFLDEAKEHIFPKIKSWRGLQKTLQNLFSSKNYAEGLALITDRKLELSKDEFADLFILLRSEENAKNFELTLRDYLNSTVMDSNGEDKSTVVVDLPLLMNEFVDALEQQAEPTLQILSESIHDNTKILEEQRIQAEKIAALKESKDGIFSEANLAFKCSVAWTEVKAKAESVMNTDPVRAHLYLSKQGAQIIHDAEDLQGMALRIQKLVDAYAPLSPWQEDALGEASKAFSRIADNLKNGSQHKAIDELHESIELIIDVHEGSKQTQTTRERLAKSLGLASNQILVEENANPDESIALAKENILDAIRCIPTQNAKADRLIAKADVAVKVAEGLIEEAVETAKAFEDRVQKGDENSNKLLADGRQADNDHTEMEQVYIAKYADTFDGIHESWEQKNTTAITLLREAEAAFNEGSLISSNALLRRAEDILQKTSVGVQAVTKTYSDLKKIDAENKEALKNLVSQKIQVKEHLDKNDIDRAKANTLYQQTAKALKEVEEEKTLFQLPRDPKEIADHLAKLQAGFKESYSLASLDRAAYETAVQANTSADGYIYSAKNYSGYRGTRVTVSPWTDEMSDALQALKDKKYELAATLYKEAGREAKAAENYSRSEAARKKRADEEAAESARRARERSNSYGSSGGSIGGGGGSAGGRL